jgi:lysylphosphatidylglycerol synthetase-like protein (DUF2156 family)
VTFWSDIGYESSHFTTNLSSVFFFYLGAPAYMLALWLFKQLANITRLPWLIKYAEGHHEKAYWNFFIGFVDGTYLLVCIAALINMRQQHLGQLPADANFLIATIFFVAVVVGFPVFIVLNYLVCRGKEDLEDEEFQERQGGLYEDYDFKKKGKLVFIHTLALLARMLLLAVVVCLMIERPSLQIVSILFI